MATAGNQLIELLPRQDRRRLLAVCEPVELRLSDVLNERDSPTRHVYFPTQGFISLVVATEGSPGLEVGMVGREGMLGAQLTLGVVTAPLRAVVQGPGTSWRIAVVEFRRELARGIALQRALQRYVYVLMMQLTRSAACLRFHQIGQRLARWLLMSQDRSYSDRFLITHEFLAYMLGVRRVGITTAAVALQRNGLIEYHRGELTVLNRKGLEAAACACYRADRQAYATVVIGNKRRAST